jgi:hypothetical protein
MRNPVNASGIRKINRAIARGWRPGMSIRDVLRRHTRKGEARNAG